MRSFFSAGLICSRRLLLPAALALGLAAGCRKTAPEEALPTVSVLAVQSTSYADPVIAFGTIEPVQSVSLGFRVSGQIIAVDAADGEVVAEQSVLARLDPTEFEHAVTIAQARADELRSRHTRLETLYRAGSLTQTDFEKSRAALTEAEAALQLAVERLDYTTLTAPFAGKLIRRNIDVGAVVAPGTPVFTLMAEQPVWAEVRIAESDRPHLAEGQSATVAVPALEEPNAAATSGLLPGSIESIGAVADPFSRTFLARIRLANTDGRLHLGNVVTAQIEAGREHEGILLPPAAVQREPDGSLYVWLLRMGDGSAQVLKRAVSAGGAQDSFVVIDQGLAAGDRVVTGSTTPLFDGRQVKVIAP